MAAHQAPPSLGFSSQEHWSGLPLPSPILSAYREVNKGNLKLQTEVCDLWGWLSILQCHIIFWLINTLQLCCSTHRHEGKIFFFLACTGSFLLCGLLSIWDERGLFSRVGSTVTHCSGFFCCEAQALGTQAWVVLPHKLSICGSST